MIDMLLETLLIEERLLIHADKLIAIPTLIFLGLSLRIILQAFGQTWIQTKAHTTTILVLPIITFVIVNTGLATSTCVVNETSILLLLA